MNTALVAGALLPMAARADWRDHPAECGRAENIRDCDEADDVGDASGHGFDNNCDDSTGGVDAVHPDCGDDRGVERACTDNVCAGCGAGGVRTDALIRSSTLRDLSQTAAFCEATGSGENCPAGLCGTRADFCSGDGARCGSGCDGTCACADDCAGRSTIGHERQRKPPTVAGPEPILRFTTA